MDNRQFNPNDIGIPNGNYFALPFTPEESELVIISAPWDVTTSYRPGAANAPDAILDASTQVDLFDYDFHTKFMRGIGTNPFNEDILSESKRLRPLAEKVISLLSIGIETDEWTLKKNIEKVNEGSEKLNEEIYDTAKKYLEKNKKVALVGGDHSTPFGLIKAVAEKNEEIAVLHIDAHADLREAYEGFTYSHASIMYNVMKDIPEVTRLVQVGIRDFSEEEYDMIRSNDKIVTFFDREIQNRKFGGETWESICDSIMEVLPHRIHISMDIDGLSPAYCPNTGTPVPGGMTFNELVYLLVRIHEKGKEVVGFDLTEVAPTEDCDSLDANIGARLLYKLCLLALSK